MSRFVEQEPSPSRIPGTDWWLLVIFALAVVTVSMVLAVVGVLLFR